MPLPFRQRIFVILVALTAVPTALAVVGWALAVRTVGPSAGARVALEEMAASAREMLDHMDTTRLAPAERAALRQALRELATALEAARDKELEAERLRAFREVARRVAHEIKNPLTSMRIAVDQLGRSGGPVDGRATAVEVLAAETRRLERLAKEFSEFGRLPEEPKSEVDLVDLLVELGRSAVPDDVAVTVRANGAGEGPPCRLLGHYEPLRRAFSNLLRNAAEAMDGHGTIEIAVSRDGPGILVTIADHGRGISDELRHRVFEPYFTTKQDGTGLGLALVRQTVEAHNGSITVADTPA